MSEAGTWTGRWRQKGNCNRQSQTVRTWNHTGYGKKTHRGKRRKNMQDLPSLHTKINNIQRRDSNTKNKIIKLSESHWREYHHAVGEGKMLNGTQKTSAINKKIDEYNYRKNKFVSWIDTIKGVKEQAAEMRKIQAKDLYSVFIKSSYKLIRKRPTTQFFKVGKRHNR